MFPWATIGQQAALGGFKWFLTTASWKDATEEKVEPFAIMEQAMAKNNDVLAC